MRPYIDNTRQHSVYIAHSFYPHCLSNALTFRIEDTFIIKSYENCVPPVSPPLGTGVSAPLGTGVSASSVDFTGVSAPLGTGVSAPLGTGVSAPLGTGVSASSVDFTGVSAPLGTGVSAPL